MLDIKKRIYTYLLITIFTLLFSIIYEYFSFGVISYFMILSFLIPLFGLLLNYISYKLKINNELKILDLSVLTLTLGSVIRGILDIYGTTNHLLIYHLYVGLLLLFIFILIMIIKLFRKKVK